MHAFIHPFNQSINQSINQSRIDQEVVMLLLHYDACATVINGTAQIPKDVTQNPEIRSMLEGERDTSSSKRIHGNNLLFNVLILVRTICLNNTKTPPACLLVTLTLLLTSAAERTEERKLEEELLEAAREGNLSTLTQLVSARCWYLIRFLSGKLCDTTVIL